MGRESAGIAEAAARISAKRCQTGERGSGGEGDSAIIPLQSQGCYVEPRLAEAESPEAIAAVASNPAGATPPRVWAGGLARATPKESELDPRCPPTRRRPGRV